MKYLKEYWIYIMFALAYLLYAIEKRWDYITFFGLN